MAVVLTPTRDALLSTARTLPAAPQVLGGLCELLQDVNSDLDQISGQIAMDATLASRVIRISNSIVFGGGGMIGSVEEAVSRVGFSEVVRLVGAATAAGLVDRALACYHLDVDPLREALLMHALASEALAEAAGLDRRTAYVAGLMRGIGVMVLDRFARARLQPQDTFDPSQFETYRQWEIARFNVTAVDVTTMALDDWKFPGEMAAAVAVHLQPPTGDDDTSRLATVLNLAGTIATQHGYALPGEVLFWVRTPEKLATIGIDEDQFALAGEQALGTFEQQRHALY
jgi:HD-like signal output (HDOD) protein